MICPECRRVDRSRHHRYYCPLGALLRQATAAWKRLVETDSDFRIYVEGIHGADTVRQMLATD